MERLLILPNISVYALYRQRAIIIVIFTSFVILFIVGNIVDAILVARRITLNRSCIDLHNPVTSFFPWCSLPISLVLLSSSSYPKNLRLISAVCDAILFVLTIRGSWRGSALSEDAHIPSLFYIMLREGVWVYVCTFGGYVQTSFENGLC